MARRGVEDYRYILLKDRVGEIEKSENVVMGALRKLVQKQVNVLRGELLVPVDPNIKVYQRDEVQHLRLRRDSNIAIYCVEDDIAPLTHSDYKLLQAIESPTDRYATFSTENKLEWGENLKEGDQVYVHVPSAVRSGVTSWSLAVIRYKGPVEGLLGMVFGVEIKDTRYRGKGTTDGWFRNEYYFRCEKDCALFVALDMLAHDPPYASQLFSKATAKKNYSYEQLKEALGGESITAAEQQRILDKIKKEKGDQQSDSDRLQHPGSVNPQHLSARPDGQQLVKQHSWQPKEHMYDTIPGDSPSARRRFVEQGKSASFAQGEGVHKNISQEGFNPQPGARQSFQPQNNYDINQQQWEERRGFHQQYQDQPPVQPAQAMGNSHGGVAAITVPPGSTVPSPPSGLDVSSTIQIPSSDPSHPPQYGVIRWLGEFPNVQCTIAGIEMEDYMHDGSDGTWHGQKVFDCPPGKGMFYPLHNLRPDERFSEHPEARRDPPSVAAALTTNTLDVGSTIQISTADPHQPHQYGVIRWIGQIPNVQGAIAGIEMEDYIDGGTDGSYNGHKYFDCPHGKGIFYDLHKLRPDERFLDPSGGSGSAGRENPLNDVLLSENVDQTIGTNQLGKYVGEGRGIQGHQNSCYLDATVFGLFGLSDVFDTMFLEESVMTTDLNRKAIADLLWKGIVNPLRKYGVVRYESVMKLRNKLDELGKMEGITQDEKDPEGFLNMLFKHMLRVEPFISIRHPFGVEQEFFVQLFLEFDESLRLPTVGDLLRKMFREQKISFTEMPSKLLIQIPRFGREFKTYQKIVPDLKLQIMDLTDTYANTNVPSCLFCGDEAVVKCEECPNHFDSPDPDAVYFCENCDKLAHKVETRRDKHIRDTALAGVSELELLSVICIETSHYVCFTKELQDEESDQPSRWIFFDSMANRVYDTYNIPKVEECTALLNEWVYPSNNDRTQLMSTPPKQLPEYVHRFTQDVYMCVYIEPDASMYGSGCTPVSQLQPAVKRAERSGFSKTERASTASNRRLQQQISHLEDLLAKETQQCEEKDGHLRKAENESFLLRQQVEQLQQELRDATQRKQHLEEQNQQLEEQNEHLEQQKQQDNQRKQQLENDVREARELSAQLQQRLQETEQRLMQATPAEDVRFTQLQAPAQGRDSWNVPRDQVEIHEEIGNGGWGTVSKGCFNNQIVAVKQAHRAILKQAYTIPGLKREIQIMAHVQHPNLVRFIAAVIDEQVERREKTPLLIVELLDMNLRDAYETTNLGTNTIPIFRDVAYGLHYLHEHAVPIIHRDVSAPNVLLEKLPGGMYRAKLSDFGSANKAKDAKTLAGGAIGYSAPETFPQADIRIPVPPQTPKIDVFSYGVLLAEVITKTMPTAENRWELVLQVEGKWKLMYELISACIKPNPSDRLTMAGVLNKLNRIPTPRPRSRPI